MNKTHVRDSKGFTLIELLVVVLIIGILASIAIPQYFKVVERARVAEAHTFISQVKQAQERYLARNGMYATSNADMNGLDISFPGAAPAYGMKFYTAKLDAGSGTGCTDPNASKYNIAITRVTANAGVAPRYGTYSVLFERCAADLQYPSCANCTTDFAQ